MDEVEQDEDEPEPSYPPIQLASGTVVVGISDDEDLHSGALCTAHLIIFFSPPPPSLSSSAPHSLIWSKPCSWESRGKHSFLNPETFSFKAKMGEVEDGFTPLSQLNLSSDYRRRVRVRVSRMWVSFNPNNGTVFGLDSLLIDSKGGTMQAHVKPKDIKRFEERLAEGKVYALSNFVVWPSEGKYMTCRNPFKMHIEADTVVDEIDGDVDAIPLHCFDFVDFVDVPSRDRKISLLTDIVRQVVEVWGIERTPKKLRMIEFCSLRIEDFSGKELYVTLYGKLGHDFYAEIRKKCRQDPVAAVFAGMRVCHYKGGIIQKSP
ncbi:replication protein A 70 kDa DNA-binding subunit A-like [Triticum urartu]|uniref:replication protein A 70 kDa DNA-binding subunit A-like n=1 Tax=Triticum urartu TaxID=4572 RepID=UPI002042D861|nr:replication protein A 70 kDa DNA-binding subunit A-like [Triticum urartu]